MKSESRIQQECVQWYRNNYCLKHHTPAGLIFSVPNERADKLEQMRMIATGLMSGVSDLIVITPKSQVIFVECKDDKGRQTDKQKDFEAKLLALDLKYYLIRSIDEFKKIPEIAEIQR